MTMKVFVVLLGLITATLIVSGKRELGVDCYGGREGLGNDSGVPTSQEFRKLLR